MAENSQILERVLASHEVGLVFQRLWDPQGDTYRKFFLTHPELLFPHIEGNGLRLMLPVLFVGSENSPDVDRTLVATGEARDARRDALVRAKKSVADSFERDFKTVANLLILRYLHRNPALHALLGEGEPTLARVSKALAGAPLNLDLFEEFSERPKEDQIIDGALRDKVMQYSNAVKGFVRRGDFVELAAAFDLSFQTLPFLEPARDKLKELLGARALEYDEYLELLQDLYRGRLISNVSTTWWCFGCQDDVTVLTTQSRVSPTQLGMKCPKCRRAMAVATLFQCDQTLRDCLSERDGLLGVGVSWLLDKKGIRYEMGTYVGDQELDFRFKIAERDVLLECKVHKTNRDAEATIQHLVKDIDQAAKHADAVRKAGQRLDTAWILTNYDLNSIEDELSKALRKCGEKVRAFSIEVIDAKDFVRALDGKLAAGI